MIELPADIVTADAAATVAFGRELVTGLPEFAVLLLIGELGAGKTTLMKGLAAGWDVAAEEAVASPTYTLIHEYRRGARVLYHLDLYRIATGAELETLGLEDILALPPPGQEKLIAIEWGERLIGRLPPPYIRVELRAIPGPGAAVDTGDQPRRITAAWIGEPRRAALR